MNLEVDAYRIESLGDLMEMLPRTDALFVAS